MAQLMLLDCYYRARRDSSHEGPVKAAVLEEFLANAHYETDIAVGILQKVDDKYLELRAEKLKRQSSNDR